MDIVIVRQISVVVNEMGCLMDMKQMGNLTECRVGGITCYVREGNDHRASFYVHANERWGFKIRGASRKHQVLYLCAPQAQWAAIAAAVHRADHLHREVLPNRRFTERWALACFARDDHKRETGLIGTPRAIAGEASGAIAGDGPRHD